MALNKFDFHECVRERLRAASVYKFEESMASGPDYLEHTKKQSASLNKSTVASNLVCNRETSHVSGLGNKKQFNQIFPEQFNHPAQNVLKFGKKLRLIKVASGHVTSLGRLDFILLPNKDLIISVTQNSGNPRRVKYSCNKSPEQILQLANSSQSMPSVEANQSSNVIEEKIAKQAFERGLAKAQKQDYFAAFEIWKVGADRGTDPLLLV